MIVGFLPRFVQPIQDGTKIHTFRLDAGNRFGNEGKPRLLHCATGVRTKHYNCFAIKEYSGSQRCEISYDFVGYVGEREGYHQWCVCVNYRLLQPDQAEAFARNDGFESLNHLITCLCEMHGKQERYIGKLIHWTPFRY